jgi:hypothetical protein
MNPLAVFALAGLIQGPDEMIAHYTLDGKPAVVTRADVAMEMAFHLRRMEEGRQACDVMVNSALTEREAKRLGLMPKEVEIQRFWGKLQEQLRAAGRDPKSFAAVRNSTGVEWMHDLGLQLAQESLVRHALSLDNPNRRLPRGRRPGLVP